MLCYRPPDECLHGKKIDDGKEKPQIIKFYDLTKGGNDIVDQLNDYYTTRSKSCCWVTVVLSYARVNGKTMWCLKNDPDISSTSSNDFSWNLAKALALLHVQRRSLNGLASSVQLKINMFLGTTLLVDEPVPKVERRLTGTGHRRKYQFTHGQLSHKHRKGQCPKIN